jgi:hypothetical protein
MQPKSLQPELRHTCDHPGGCGHDAAATGTPYINSAGVTLTNRPDLQEGGRWDSLKRYAVWFLAFFGIYASSSVCPFCGAPGCPVGVGGAALVGGVFACLWQYGKSVWEKLRGFIANGSR